MVSSWVERKEWVLGRRGKERGWNGECLPVASFPQSIGGRPSAKNQEAVVGAWSSHGGNWRKMLTQDKLRTAEQC